jgi:hypothetical protein
MAARSRDTSSRAAQGAPRNDAYTGLLAISLLAQIVGVVFFYLDWSGYPSSKPTVPQMPSLSAPAAGGAPAPAPGGVAPGGAAPGAAAPGGAPPMAGGAPPMGGGNP